MHDNDSIDDMVTRYTKITNDLASLVMLLIITKRQERSFVYYHLHGRSRLQHWMSWITKKRWNLSVSSATLRLMRWRGKLEKK